MGAHQVVEKSLHNFTIPSAASVHHSAMLLYKFGSWYNAHLDSYPLITKAATTSAIGLLGDAAAQFQEERLRMKAAPSPSSRKIRLFRYNTRRGLATAANNFLLTAPFYHYGYDWLNSLIPIYGNAGALAQVLIDCTVFDALFVLLMFLESRIVNRYNNHRYKAAASAAEDSIRTNLLPAIFASWKLSFVMAPLEFILFRYFPIRLRVLGMNAIDLVWDAVISFVVYRDKNGKGSCGGKDGCGEEEDEQSEDLSATVTSSSHGTTRSSAMSTPRSTPSYHDDSADDGYNLRSKQKRS